MYSHFAGARKETDTVKSISKITIMGRRLPISKIGLILIIVAVTLYSHHRITSVVEKFEKATQTLKNEENKETRNGHGILGEAILPEQPAETLVHRRQPVEAVQTQQEIGSIVREPVPPTHREKSIIPDASVLEDMPLAELMDLFDGYIFGTQVVCGRRIRMGKVQDGGWDYCADPPYKPKPENCLVYSFGINNDFSFDDAMEQYGCEVHSYDPSMDVEDHVRGKKIHFHKEGIAGQNGNNTKGWKLYTLGTIRKRNGHEPEKRKVDMVKMDVEGSELKTLLTAVKEGALKDVTQLNFEMHIYAVRAKGNGDPNKSYLVSMLGLLRKLWEDGFRLYHTNRNTIPQLIYRSKTDGKLRTICHELYLVKPRRH